MAELNHSVECRMPDTVPDMDGATVSTELNTLSIRMGVYTAVMDFSTGVTRWYRACTKAEWEERYGDGIGGRAADDAGNVAGGG